jgi:hypothetical protein
VNVRRGGIVKTKRLTLYRKTNVFWFLDIRFHRARSEEVGPKKNWQNTPEKQMAPQRGIKAPRLHLCTLLCACECVWVCVYVCVSVDLCVCVFEPKMVFMCRRDISIYIQVIWDSAFGSSKMFFCKGDTICSAE